jgi:hypothetical protein
LSQPITLLLYLPMFRLLVLYFTRCDIIIILSQWRWITVLVWLSRFCGLNCPLFSIPWPLPNTFSNFSPPISAGVCVGQYAYVQYGTTLISPRHHGGYENA